MDLKGCGAAPNVRIVLVANYFTRLNAILTVVRLKIIREKWGLRRAMLQGDRMVYEHEGSVHPIGEDFPNPRVPCSKDLGISELN